MRTNENWKCCDKYDGLLETIETPNNKQYGKAVCIYCRHFIKFVPNPNLKYHHDLLEQLTDEAIWKKLEPIEQNFVTKCKNHAVLTPKQINYLKLLHSYYQNPN